MDHAELQKIYRRIYNIEYHRKRLEDDPEGIRMRHRMWRAHRRMEADPNLTIEEAMYPKRGRPREKFEVPAEVAEIPRRPRGRPRKEKPQEPAPAEVPPARRRGRPKKVQPQEPVA